MAAKQNEPHECCIRAKEDLCDLPCEIRDAELKAICERREALRSGGQSNSDPQQGSISERLVGLALSGGGIRSATFSLGVMQRLAKEECLQHVDYLSTVSGGGYIGGSLTWLLNAPANCGEFGTIFPYGVDNPRRKRHRMDHPPILNHLRRHGKYLIPGGGITMTSLIAVILRGILLNLVVWFPLAVGFIAMLMAVCSQDGLLLLLYPAGFMGLLFLVTSLIYSVATRIPACAGSYSLRRIFEKWIRLPLWLAIVCLVPGSLPLVEKMLAGHIEHVGAASFLLGIIGGLASFLSSGSKDSGRVSLAILAPIASILFLYGLVLASYSLASLCFESSGHYAWVILGISVAVSLVTGWLVNLNYISIHRYYRDRLMEAFMPCPNTDGTCQTAKESDKANLSDMRSSHAPYHLVNTNVVLVDSEDTKRRIRGGDAFLLSPRYCGSSATGWVKTKNYMKKDPLTLATAVAISGAAANPNTAAGGAGPTRKPALSLLMALLNVRLGYWVPHPCKPKPRRVANHFRAAYYELSPHGYAKRQKLLQLSDGGHFENLGVYELVRRRVKLIICCDGTADPEFSFSDLQVLVRRIGADFGARIEFDSCNQLERIIPRNRGPLYPVGVKFADRGYIKGKIIYPETNGDGQPVESTLILLKTTMIKNLGLLLKGYKGANPDFPDQSTADQFFDEEQFEAYRELGYEIAKRMIDGVGLKRLLCGCR